MVVVPVVVTPPVAPTPITITLHAEPAGARITAAGTALTCNPCQLTGAPGTKQQVRVAAEGMAETTLEVTFDQDRTEKVVLVAAPVVATPEPAIDAGRPGKKKKTPKGLSVDEKNPYQ
jgi:hypothetical protein